MVAWGNLLAGASKVAGVSTGYFERLLQIESSGGTNLYNPNSSASGPWQFIGSTAKQYGLNNETVLDPAASTNAVARFTRDNYNALKRGLGRAPTEGELYLAHQQGAGGALALLTNPNALASEIVGAKEIIDNGGNFGMSAGEFAQKWTAQFNPAFPFGGLDEETQEQMDSAAAPYIEQATGVFDWAEEWIIRIIVVILGFIFVAVGLALFKPAMAVIKERVLD